MRFLTRGRVAVCAMAVLMLLSVTLRPADARIYTVTTTTDIIAVNGQVSLR